MASRAPGRVAEPELPEGDLPEDWEDRLDKLRCPTLVHVPVQLRARLASVMTATLSGMARGDEFASALEQGRSKLLYGVPPSRFSVRTELAKRLELWNEGCSEELLLSFELHVELLELIAHRWILDRDEWRPLVHRPSYPKAPICLR